MGGGGAQVIRPSLTHPMSLNLTPMAAAGVSVSSLSFASAAGAGKFLWNEQYDHSTALAVMIPAVIGARLGVRVAERMGKEMQNLTFNVMSAVLIPTHLFVQYRKERSRQEVQGLEYYECNFFSRVKKNFGFFFINVVVIQQNESQLSLVPRDKQSS